MNTILVTTTVTAALCGLSLITQGQTFSEWFFQRKTRMKYLRLQVASLEVLEHTVRVGYDGTADGLGHAEEEEFTVVDMDETWLTSLGTVRDLFRNSKVTKLIYHAAGYLRDRSDKYTGLYETNPWLSESEKEQVQFDLGLVKADMQGLLKDLLRCMTDGEMEMTDEERWMLIHELFRHTVITCRFQKKLIERTEELIATRRQQAANIDFLKKMRP